MHVIVWEFTVRPEHRAVFERGYGPDGDWARFFQRDPSFRGVELWRGGELDDPEWDRYLTADRWASLEAYHAFRERTEAEYQELDKRFLELCETETMLGIFEVVD
jgi:heme-degrading monooxygenase HmoA